MLRLSTIIYASSSETTILCHHYYGILILKVWLTLFAFLKRYKIYVTMSSEMILRFKGNKVRLVGKEKHEGRRRIASKILIKNLKTRKLGKTLK
jgi:hypothetical protein